MEKENIQENNSDNFTINLIIMIFSILFLIIFFFYLTLIILYIIKNYHKKKLCIFWINYFYIIITVIFFILIYIIYLSINSNNRIDKPIDLSNNSFSISITILLCVICHTIIENLLYDGFTAIKLSLKMYGIKSIKEKDLSAIAIKCKNMNINNYLELKKNIIFIIIFIIVNISFIVLTYYAYTDTIIERFNTYFNLTYLLIILKIYYFIILLFLIISIVIMNKNKRALLNKNYINENRIAQKLYNTHFNQVIYYSDIMSYKIVTDLIINIPVLLFLSLSKFNVYSLFISEIAMMVYIIIAGNEYFVIDKDNKAAKLNIYIKYFFCFKKIHLHFGEKEYRVIFDEFNFEYSEEEQSIISNSDMTFVRNSEYKLIGDGNSLEPLLETSLIELESKSRKSSRSSNTSPRKLDFKLVSEFYLVQKLLMIFYKKNEQFYSTSLKNMEENCNAFKKLGQEKNRKKTKHLTEDFKNDLDRISRVSVRDRSKIISLSKIPQNDIFKSFEEKELFEEIRNKFNINNENYSFTIESLLTSYFFELFPFYQMDIKSILKSLNPSRNIRLFSKFIERNTKNRNKFTIMNQNDIISVKSFINNNDNLNTLDEDIVNKKDSEKNLFYTHDLLLMYEIYEEKNFIKFEEFQKIIKEYNRYLLSIVQNMSYSFLPLILGVFNLEIYDSNLIVILYRNPLYFTGFNNFNHWINFYITENPEKIKVSSMFNDIINLNEIEIKNNLELSEADYEEIKTNLKNDYKFIVKLKNIYPVIHLFIGDQNKLKNESEEEKIKKVNAQILYNENSFMGDYSMNNEDNLIFDIMRDSSINNFNDDEYISNINEVNSLYDKEYYSVSGNDLRTIKIYFTNLFRKECELNKSDNNFKINSESYCQYLEGQLINYLNKESLFNEDKEEEEDEK